MNFLPYTIIDKKQELDDTYIFRVVPEKGNIFDFTAGQYCYLINKTYKDSQEPHPFSIASSPLQKNYLEFCIKTYGDWTKEFIKKDIGENVLISNPRGEFTWSSDIMSAVFLLGGIGISPIISMMRTLVQSSQTIPITILYGNRTPETIAYKTELEELTTQFTSLKIIHIFSDIDSHHIWKGYRGFITKDIIQKEVYVDEKPTFYIVGPPIFVEKMNAILAQLHVNDTHIKQELLTITSKAYEQNRYSE